MSFDTDFITRMLDNDHADLFWCDSHMQVTAVSEKIKQSGLAIYPGQTLDEIFIGCTRELEKASEMLRTGALFYSTKFEYSLVQSTIFLLPLMEGGALSAVLCCLNFPDSSDLFPDGNWVLPFISDRYRAPISNILNILQMFAGKFQASEDYAALNFLNAAAQNCYEMLKSAIMVKRYYALVNSRADYRPEWRDLKDFVNNLYQSLRALMMDTQYNLVLETDIRSLLTRFDEKLLSLAILNLIANSCTYSPSDSTITVTLSMKGETAYLSVADEGIGIDRGDLEKVFDPFYSKRDIPVTEDEIGLGLGLPIAKKVAELHGGRIFVTSERNRGTTVAITLPISNPTTSDITLSSGSAKYVTDRYSDMYLLFANICKINLY